MPGCEFAEAYFRFFSCCVTWVLTKMRNSELLQDIFVVVM